MSRSINKTYPFQTTLTLTTEAADALKQLAAERDTDVRRLVRSLIDNHLRATGYIGAFNPSLQQDLEEIARRRDTTPQKLVTNWTIAGVLSEQMKYNLTPTPPAPED